MRLPAVRNRRHYDVDDGGLHIDHHVDVVDNDDIGGGSSECSDGGEAANRTNWSRTPCVGDTK